MLGIAAAALASCTNNEVMEVADSRAIGFDAFVGNATKADITDDNISEFYVFGGYNNSFTNVFNNAVVSKSDGGWTYTPTQYWTASKAYTFQGYAPKIETKVDPTATGVKFTDFVANGETDLLASKVASVNTDSQITTMSAVQLDFRHVLSKIKFKFTTDLANVNITISDLKVKQLPGKGTYTNSGSTGTWAVSDAQDYTLTSNGTLTNSAALTSGDAIVLPQTPSDIKVTFTLNATGGIELKDKAITTTLPNTKLEEGNVYVYTAKIDAKNIDPEGELVPIVFDAPIVDAWASEAAGGDVTVSTGDGD